MRKIAGIKIKVRTGDNRVCFVLDDGEVVEFSGCRILHCQLERTPPMRLTLDEFEVGFVENEFVEVTHKVPAEGDGVTPCCGRTVFELPQGDRISNDDKLVTCRGITHD